MPDDPMPDYEPMLAAYHEAFADEIGAMVGSLPIREGDLVLELACGDGAYTHRLAGRVGPSGSVVAVDLLMAYLRRASRDARSGKIATRAGFVAASFDRLPFADGRFDVAWCAQSLFSLPEPVDSVRRMARAVRPGGVVAVLEDDKLHQVLLPWPIEVELAVRAAEWRALRDESDHPAKFYVGRRLVGVFREAGLVDVRARTYAADRVAPLDGPTRTFLGEYLRGLRERVSPHLDPATRGHLDRLADPDSPEHLLDQPDFAVTLIDHVIHGRNPAG